jgi:D-tyrosyl-tRNA(Tyr) deacylase
MRAVLQRVSFGKVIVEEQVVASIDKGLMILLGVGPEDTIAKAEELAEKCARLRIFEDENDKMNLSLLDIGGEAIVVSQFTLYADTSRGRRPSFVYAAKPEIAEPLVDVFAAKLRKLGVKTGQGVFGAHMMVELCNDGPVTILLEV